MPALKFPDAHSLPSLPAPHPDIRTCTSAQDHRLSTHTTPRSEQDPGPKASGYALTPPLPLTPASALAGFTPARPAGASFVRRQRWHP